MRQRNLNRKFWLYLIKPSHYDDDGTSDRTHWMT